MKDARLIMSIHTGLFNTKIGGIKVKNIVYPITLHTNGCRKITIGKFTFIQQNPAAKTKYGRLASKGNKITWGMQEDGEWILVINNKIENYEDFTDSI